MTTRPCYRRSVVECYNDVVDTIENLLTKDGFHRKGKSSRKSRAHLLVRGSAGRQAVHLILHYRIPEPDGHIVCYGNVRFREIARVLKRVVGSAWAVAEAAELGHLGPEHRYQTWPITPLTDAAALAHELVLLIRRYLFPFFEARSTLAGLVHCWLAGDVHNAEPDVDLQLAVGLWLLGRGVEALNVLEAAIAKQREFNGTEGRSRRKGSATRLEKLRDFLEAGGLPSRVS